MLQFIRNRVERILKLPLVSNTLKLSSSSALMMFLPLVVTPILSRLYTPEDYGDWGVYSSLLYIIGALIFLSYENTIVKSNDDEEIPSLIALCIIILLIILLCVAIVFFIGKWIGLRFFECFPSLTYLLFGVFFSGLYTLASNYANRKNQYSSMAFASIVNGLSQAALRILFGVLPLISYGLICGNVLAQGIATFFLLFLIRKIFPISFFQQISLRAIKKIAINYKKFPIYDAPARLIEFAIGNVAIIILYSFWSKDDVGCFSIVTQFLLIPMTIIGSAMSNVFFRELSEKSDDLGAISDVTRKSAKITFSIAMIPTLFLACGGDYLFVKFLGTRWNDAGTMALCMSVFSVPIILSEPLLAVFKTLDQQEIRFRINLFNVTISLGILVLSSMFLRNIHLSILLYSISYATARFILFYYELKLANVSFLSVSRYFLISITGCYLLVAVRLFFAFL